ncbi:Metallo-dependent phosphatase-like protein [Boletus reticuloceps]|uniref:Metallo-dependent phosphatase-like protein n=1 Tax=Boletus reticuloceps TaxID=495285 RepID=A0A8I2YX53_9AGAM|nr:Metallo-dependent phosphatase-like protein [Boletus reticuloceps]
MSSNKLPLDRGLLRNGLCTAWILAVLWLELGAFRFALHYCRWPDTRQPQIPGSRIVRILVIADPQIIDRHSYPGRGPLLSTLSQYFVDLNLRKSWDSAFHRLRPHAVVVLGDMMDSGRLSMSNTEYEAYFKRYQSIFNMGDSPPPVYYLPGNHDVGLGNLPQFSLEAHMRYISHFGSRNYRRTVGNHTLVFIDAPALVEEDVLRAESGHTFDSWPALSNGPVEFVKQTASAGSLGPIVLFTHIPLSRPSDASCGPLREKGTIRQGYGFGYQNTLVDGTTEFLLQSLKPSLVMSGDDHDYCEYEHTIASSDEKIQEVTVKSISMAMGIRRPGFQLLSLISTVPSPDHITQMPVPPPLHALCLMPDQLGTYFYIYIPLILLTLVVLLAFNITRANGGIRYQTWGTKHSRQGTPEPPHELTRGNSSHAADAESFLPEPASKPREHCSRGRSYSSPWIWRFSLAGHRRRITLPNPFGICQRSRVDRRSSQRDVGGLVGFLQDVGMVAWPPILVFLGISFWVMRW